MKIIKTKIKGLVLIKTKIHADRRGFFKEVEKNNVTKKKFIFDCFSFSKKNTLRGLHLQKKRPQAKIITVVHGKILDVVVDLRKSHLHMVSILQYRYLKILTFLFTFQKILLMVFYVYLKYVVYFINVLIIDIKKVRQLSNGMIRN